LLSVLFAGGAIVPDLKFDPRETLRAVERHKVTDLLLIPTMTLAVLDALVDTPVDTTSLRGMLSSGGRTPPGLWDRILAAFRGIEITTGYGMSECTASTTVTRPDDPTDRLRTTNGRLRDVGPAGDPAIGHRLVDYRVVDPQTGAVLAPGEVGELMAKGPGVTAGYYDKPEATAEAFDAHGWLHTGDLGRIDAEGYLSLVGRVKESYRCGGEQVTPSEIEDVLMIHPSVLQAHVAPAPDDRMGEIGVAFVVVRAGHALDPQALIEWCAARLARFKVPRHILPIDAADVPLTASGRPRKFLLSLTGAARGIGAAIAERLAADGCDIAVMDLDAVTCGDTVARIEAQGRRAVAVAVDVADEASVQTAVMAAEAALGPPAVLVNNAGVLREKTLPKMTLDDWQVVQDVNLRGAFLMCRAVQPAMRRLGHGRIVNLASIAALGAYGQANYAAAKAGLIGLTKTLALEMGKSGITANVVAPGFVVTPMTAAVAERLGVTFEAMIADVVRDIPVGRPGQPEDIANAVAFFADARSGFISGQVLFAAGGPRG
ncbi:hypothetical protein LTR94_023373, partial [Friedmanniomyces endolithicus]